MRSVSHIRNENPLSKKKILRSYFRFIGMKIPGMIFKLSEMKNREYFCYRHSISMGWKKRGWKITEMV